MREEGERAPALLGGACFPCHTGALFLSWPSATVSSTQDLTKVLCCLVWPPLRRSLFPRMGSLPVTPVDAYTSMADPVLRTASCNPGIGLLYLEGPQVPGKV
jgi:hypothetical protein